MLFKALFTIDCEEEMKEEHRIVEEDYTTEEIKEPEETREAKIETVEIKEDKEEETTSANGLFKFMEPLLSLTRHFSCSSTKRTDVVIPGTKPSNMDNSETRLEEGLTPAKSDI